MARSVQTRNEADKLALLLERIREGSADPRVIDAALLVTRRVRFDPERKARAIHAFVRDSVAYVVEPRERFQAAWYTLDRLAGDCDCQTILQCALQTAAGIPTGVAAWQRHGVFSHVCPTALGRYAEPTIQAFWGEHPADAARRLGAQRSDILAS